jgi:nicotinate-nucleotide pyrophosphorylase (carboxylating)
METNYIMNKSRAQIVKKFFNQASRLTTADATYKQWVFRYTFLELEKDLGEHGDITTDGLLNSEQKVAARIYANEPGVLAGSSEINYFLAASNPVFKPKIKPISITKETKDGTNFAKDDILFEFTGDARDILKVERVTLNLLQHMSGIATRTKEIVDKAKSANPNILVVPTRKTTWGLLDKKAVSLGGGGTHRIDLSDAVLIKDNHLALYGNSIKDVLLNYHPPTSPYTFFEIEIDDKKVAIETAKLIRDLQENSAIPDPAVMMFDNMKPAEIEKLVKAFKKEDLYDHFIFEASGGINENTIKGYAKSGVDVVSMGALTQNIRPIDLSLEIGLV